MLTLPLDPRLIIQFSLFLVTSSFLNGMDSDAAKERLIELRAAVAHHDRLYFEEGQPEISDDAYDRLVTELAELERAYSGLMDSSNGAAVPAAPAADATDLPTRHRVPMLSLRKGNTIQEVRRFYERISRECAVDLPEICVEPKIDGMAVSLVYRSGRLYRALTRGNGSVGVDVTRNIRAAGHVPEVLQAESGNGFPDYLELRGELFIKPSNFEDLNASRIAAGKAPFSTERNLAAGTVLADDSALVTGRHLRLRIFDWGAWEPVDSQPESQEAFLAQVRAWGLPAIVSLGNSTGIDTLLEIVEDAEREAGTLDLPLDGLVLKVNDVRLRDLLGVGAQSPNWAMAYKFAPQEMVTTLIGVTFQISRSGRLSPVALLEPVTLSGREISRASLYNWEFIREHDLRLGDSLVLELSGDVIPRISGLKAAASNPASEPVPLPQECPECGSPVDFSSNLDSGFCRSRTCSGRLREQIAHFGSVLKIRGLGPETARRLLEAGLISSPGDLYWLRRQPDRVAGVLGDVRGLKLIEAVEASRREPFGRYLQALGIPGIGPAGAEQIASGFASWEALLSWQADEGPLESSSLSPHLAESLGEYLGHADTRAKVRHLANALSSSDREDFVPVPSR